MKKLTIPEIKKIMAKSVDEWAKDYETPEKIRNSVVNDLNRSKDKIVHWMLGFEYSFGEYRPSHNTSLSNAIKSAVDKKAAEVVAEAVANFQITPAMKNTILKNYKDELLNNAVYQIRCEAQAEVEKQLKGMISEIVDPKSEDGESNVVLETLQSNSNN